MKTWKLLSLMLSLFLLLGATSAMADTVSFPLDEPLTLTVWTGTTEYDPQEYLESCEFYQILKEKTNISLEMIPLGATAAEVQQSMYLRLAAGQSADFFCVGANAPEAVLASLYSAGHLAVLEDYIDDEELMPNFNAVLDKWQSDTRERLNSPDGHVYTLIQGIGLKGQWLECPLTINQQWLDNLGLEVPTTLDEFTEVLRAFKEQDANGNGDPDDEIPMYYRASDNYHHFEATLGIWGMPCKNSELDAYVMIEDGEVIFVPTMDAYAEAMKTYNLWYEEGLIYQDAFVATSETQNALLTAETCVVGAFANKTIPSTSYSDEYVTILPPTVEDYETEWFIHCGYLMLGQKCYFSMLSATEYPEEVMAYIDLFYDFDTGYQARYGVPGDGRLEIVDGKYVNNSLTNEEKDAISGENPTFLQVAGQFPYAFHQDDYVNKMVLTSDQEHYVDNFDLYQDIINDEIWPRPMYSEEQSTRLSELRTDIFNVVVSYRAEWITGKTDVDETFDDFKAELEAVGIDEYVQLLQDAYDNYLSGINQ